MCISGRFRQGWVIGSALQLNSRVNLAPSAPQHPSLSGGWGYDSGEKEKSGSSPGSDCRRCSCSAGLAEASGPVHSAPPCLSSLSVQKGFQGCVRRRGGKAPGASSMASGTGKVLKMASWLLSQFTAKDSGAPRGQQHARGRRAPTPPAFSWLSGMASHAGGPCSVCVFSGSHTGRWPEPQRQARGPTGSSFPPVTCQGLGLTPGCHSGLARGGRDRPGPELSLEGVPGWAVSRGRGTVLPWTPSHLEGT